MLPDPIYYAKKQHEEKLKRQKDAEFRNAQVSGGNYTYEDEISFSPSMRRDIASILKDMRRDSSVDELDNWLPLETQFI